jgi:HEAT repeat protein
MALALGGAIIIATAVLTVLAGTRAYNRSSPAAVDLRLPDCLKDLPESSRLRLEPFSARGRSGVAIVIKGVCDKLSLCCEDTEGRPPDVALDLSIRREPIPAARPPDLETDDPRFDACYRVLGPPAIVQAVLTDAARHGLVLLLQLGDVVDVVVEKGELRVPVENFHSVREELLRKIAADALELAPRLAHPDDVPERLARNARKSEKPEVRIRQLLTLAREYPEHPATRDALLAATRDRIAEVRLRAALALGDEGQDLLLSLALDANVDDSCASRAVDALGARLPAACSAPLLERGPLLARSCVAALTRGKQPEAVTVLGHLLTTEGGDLAASAAAALADLGISSAEEPLIRALGARNPRARLAAAEALAQVGSVAAVGALEEAGQREGGELRRAARRAVAEIQGRLVGAEPGQISLAESDAGRLSLADSPAGTVSLVGEKEARKP